ncbi:glycosyltransferase N-terminal domain-containing protein [soil metagenome]
MLSFWYHIYNILLIRAIVVFFKTYSLFNDKVKRGFKGRVDLFGHLERSLLLLPEINKNILLHSSSLGEFQQALPFTEKLLKKNKNVILSFFSPSGFENAKRPKGNVVKTYLPVDTKENASRFLDIVNPEYIFFLRYDLWFNLMYEAKKRNIKLILVNARFDERDLSWKLPLASSFKKALYGMLDIAFAIDETDEKNYSDKLTHTKIVKVGDSKFERVFVAAKKVNTEILIDKRIIQDKKIFVMGSSWKDDEEVVLPALDKSLEFNSNLITFLVPHEPKETKLKAIEERINDRYPQLRAIRYSKMNGYKNENLIIVDKIGILMKLYALADLSYVGGGFRTGLHNILEPAIYNKPVFFSNKVKNSDEDEILISSGCGIIVEDTKQFYRRFRELLGNDELRLSKGKKAELVFKNNLGIAKKIVKQLGI